MNSLNLNPEQRVMVAKTVNLVLSWKDMDIEDITAYNSSLKIDMLLNCIPREILEYIKHLFNVFNVDTWDYFPLLM